MDRELFDALGAGTYRNAYFVLIVVLLMLLRQALVERNQQKQRGKVIVQV